MLTCWPDTSLLSFLTPACPAERSRWWGAIGTGEVRKRFDLNQMAYHIRFVPATHSNNDSKQLRPTGHLGIALPPAEGWNLVGCCCCSVKPYLHAQDPIKGLHARLSGCWQSCLKASTWIEAAMKTSYNDNRFSFFCNWWNIFTFTFTSNTET